MLQLKARATGSSGANACRTWRSPARAPGGGAGTQRGSQAIDEQVGDRRDRRTSVEVHQREEDHPERRRRSTSRSRTSPDRAWRAGVRRARALAQRPRRRRARATATRTCSGVAADQDVEGAAVDAAAERQAVAHEAHPLDALDREEERAEERGQIATPRGAAASSRRTRHAARGSCGTTLARGRAC